VDFKYLREPVTMEQVLPHLGLLANLRGGGPLRRGPCPVHSHPEATERTFSVHLGKTPATAIEHSRLRDRCLTASPREGLTLVKRTCAAVFLREVVVRVVNV
jgi:hypothetical protein